jgi:hypothetical protein
MYVPQFYLSAIRERWQKEYNEAAAAAAEQQRKYEEQRSDAMNKAVQ